MSAIVQAMGDNVAELIVHFGAELSNGSDIVEKDDKLIFFDVLGLFMVRPQSVVQLLQEDIASCMANFAVANANERVMSICYMDVLLFHR